MQTGRPPCPSASISASAFSAAGFPNKSLDAKRRLGYVPEMPAVYDLLTVWEHMEFIARAYRLESWEEPAAALLERFELADKKDRLGKELSKGMQQKVSICCALLPRPEVIIFDEPMVGLDPHAIKELKTVFAELKAAGASVLISTHMLDSVEDYWDIAHIMVKGRFAATKKNHDETAGEKTLEDLFFETTENGEAPPLLPDIQGEYQVKATASGAGFQKRRM